MFLGSCCSGALAVTAQSFLVVAGLALPHYLLHIQASCSSSHELLIWLIDQKGHCVVTVPIVFAPSLFV